MDTAEPIVAARAVEKFYTQPNGYRIEVIAPPEKSQNGDDPGCFRDLSPAKPPDEKERNALRALLTADQFDALMDIASRGGPDVDAAAGDARRAPRPRAAR